MKVLTVVGNRPQFVKSAPLSLALRESAVEEVVLHSGQHWDAEMSRVFFEELALPEPRHRLDLRTADIEAMTSAIAAVVEREAPDWVLVLGDTNTTAAGARASGGRPVAHVEAGLRSFDRSMPEERNRIEVDRASALLLAPDERAAAQLQAERAGGRIEVVGDVMADATRIFAPIARGRQLPVDATPPYAVLTIHRQANTEPGRLRALAAAVSGVGTRVIFPAHPRTRAVLDRHRITLGPGVTTTRPLGYLELLELLRGAHAVVTDSGGLQKEAYWLGVPCVTLRPSTEWVDTVAVGANTLAEPETLAEALAHARFPDDAPPLYGDGHAAERVAAALYA